MRRLLITLILSLAVINIIAQEHLSFMGIPLDGSVTEFCKKLKAKGFTKIGHKAIFSGYFTSRHATVYVINDGKIVNGVVVAIDESSEWNTLVSTYDLYKDLYTQKYGEPFICQEYNPSRGESNILLMHELGKGSVTYESCWQVTGGLIVLSISKLSHPNGTVIIKYMDVQNMETTLQKNLEDI